jgi:glycosyltransferase involved in cell wall biosynthesis
VLDEPPGSTGVPARSICLYTPSADPSGMGAHLLDLAAELVRRADVSVLAWPTEPGQRLLAAAEALGARPVPLPHPRSPDFGAAVVRHLRAHPAQVFHSHVGTGREDFDGVRAARAAGVPVVVQTQHYPWLMGSRKHLVPFFHAVEPVDHLIAVSDAQRDTYLRVGVEPERMTTVPNGITARGPGPGRAAARATLGLEPEQPVVMTIGRLTVMKGHVHLLDAVPSLLRRFPDLAVAVVGRGHLDDDLRAQAARARRGRRRAPARPPRRRADAARRRRRLRPAVPARGDAPGADGGDGRRAAGGGDPGDRERGGGRGG